MSHIYAQSIFEQQEDHNARTIILTPERDVDTETRWQRETPDTAEVFLKMTSISKGAVVLDYGCGIGRLAKELLNRLDITIIGVDVAEQMRVKAVAYVANPKFVVLSPEAFQSLVYANALKVDVACAVYVLQHAFEPQVAIAAIARATRYGVFTINATKRAVPVTETATQKFSWVDDGTDIHRLLLDQFPKETPHELNKSLYALHEEQFCSYFERD